MAALSHSPTHPKPRPHPHNRQDCLHRDLPGCHIHPAGRSSRAERGVGAVRAAIVEGLRRQRLGFYYREKQFICLATYAHSEPIC